MQAASGGNQERRSEQQCSEVASLSPSNTEAEETTATAVSSVEQQTSMQLTHHQRDTLLRVSRAAVHDPEIQRAFLRNSQVLSLISAFSRPPPSVQPSDSSDSSDSSPFPSTSEPSPSQPGCTSNAVSFAANPNAPKNDDGSAHLATVRISIPELLRAGASVISKRFGTEASTLQHVVSTMIEQAKDAAFAAFRYGGRDSSSEFPSERQQPHASVSNSTASSIFEASDATTFSDEMTDESSAIASLGLGVACAQPLSLPVTHIAPVCSMSQ